MSGQGVPRDSVMQGYLFGPLQLGVDEDLNPVKYALMCNSPLLKRGRRYELLDGGIIEISGILSQPAPEDREAPGPAWDHSYWVVVGWEGDNIPEAEMLDLLESTTPTLGGKCAPTAKGPRRQTPEDG